MKTILKRILFLFFIITNTFQLKAQSELQYLSMGWDFASPFLKNSKLKLNPIVFNIIDAALPKIAKQDIEGAISAVSGVFYQKYNYKALNPEYVKSLSGNFKNILPLIKQKKYLEISTILVSVVYTTNSFIKNGTLEDKTPKQTTSVENKVTPKNESKNISNKNSDKELLDKISFAKGLYLNEFNDYCFQVPINRTYLDVSKLVSTQMIEDYSKDKKIDLTSNSKTDSSNNYIDMFMIYPKNYKDAEKDLLLSMIINKSAEKNDLKKIQSKEYLEDYKKGCNCMVIGQDSISNSFYQALRYKIVQKQGEVNFIGYQIIIPQEHSTYSLIFLSPNDKFEISSKDYEEIMSSFFISK